MSLGPVALLSLQTELFGGGEHSLLLLMRGLAAAGAETRLVCPGPGRLADLARQAGVGVAYTPMPRLRGPGTLRLPAAILALRRALRGARIVHANATRPMILAALARLRRPLVYHVRQTAREPVLDRWLGATADRIIAISDAVAERFRGLPCQGRVRTVPNGVCLQTFQPRSDGTRIRANLGLPTCGAVVLASGRLHETKGLDVLIDACADRRDLFLVVVGDGPERERLVRRAAPLGARAHFLGKRDDVARIMAAADIVAVPSRAEPFGRVAIEAMACGRPVVASRVGGLLEIVVDGETGLLVPPGDAKTLSCAIATLLSDPQRARRMGAAGRLRAEARFGAGEHTQRVLGVYREIATEGEPRCA